MGPLLVVEPHVDTADLDLELLRSVGFDVHLRLAADRVDGELDVLRPGLLLVSVGPRDQDKVSVLVGRAISRGIPVVLLSTVIGRSWPGAAAVLTKPVELDVLLRTVRACFRR